MCFVRWISFSLAVAGSASLLACGPVHSVTIGRDDPGRSRPPVAVEEEGNGPPPWAPAHGYRRNHQRAYQHRDDTVDLVFDSGLGVYAVVGIPNYYYWNGIYVRFSDDRWSQAAYLDAQWAPCPDDALPGQLRSHGPKGQRDDDDDQGHGHDKGHGRGHGAGKRDDD